MSIFKLTVLFKVFVSLVALALGYIAYMTIITIYELSLSIVR